MWLALPMAAGAEESALCEEEGVDMETAFSSPRTPLPRAWQWCERTSLLQRDLRGDGSRLGCGAYGFRLALRDQATQESFCLKIPKVMGSAEAQSVKREFHMLAKLKHPNLMRVLAWVSFTKRCKPQFGR